MNKPHKHAEAIKAWADGAEIEYRAIGGDWFTTRSGDFSGLGEYRVKPERVYPATRMSGHELENVYIEAGVTEDKKDWQAVANAALRHAIDAGQVLLPPTKD